MFVAGKIKYGAVKGGSTAGFFTAESQPNPTYQKMGRFMQGKKKQKKISGVFNLWVIGFFCKWVTAGGGSHYQKMYLEFVQQLKFSTCGS